jgi:hypothetical protein
VSLGLLYLAPALVLLALLVAGLYPGERALERVRLRWAPRRLRPARAMPRPGRPPVRLLPRGGRLLGASVAARPPPLVA